MKRLYELYCNKNRIKELKLGKYDKLFYISCSFNQLEKIDLSGCRNLVNLHCRQNQLSWLDISRCPKLMSVNIEGNAFDRNGLKKFFSTLPPRPSDDFGFVVFQMNIREEEDGDGDRIWHIINKKGWREI